MAKKRKIYTGELPQMPAQKIYLNVNHLEKGKYILKIMHKNKIIKQTTFEK